jgi:hypothetical protein
MNTQAMINKACTCPLTKKHVNLHIKQTAQNNRRSACNEPALCSNIGECGCGVIKIVYGMTYSVDWKKCSLYSAVTAEH